MKKRITALLTGLAVSLALAACGSSASAASSAPAPSSQPASSVPASSAVSSQAASEENAPASSAASSAASSEAAAPETESAGGTLVVYYSATGNTEEAAGYIAELTGGDLFELTPVDDYSNDDLRWTDPESRVSTEHDAIVAGETVTVELTAVTPENWDSYDTVFIGYPIWWGEAAWPVDGFVTGNDFTGKTVIPFCTSSSSGIGQSGALLAEMAGTGDWRQGRRFSSGVSESDVRSWLNGMGL